MLWTHDRHVTDDKLRRTSSRVTISHCQNELDRDLNNALGNSKDRGGRSDPGFHDIARSKSVKFMIHGGPVGCLRLFDIGLSGHGKAEFQRKQASNPSNNSSIWEC